MIGDIQKAVAAYQRLDTLGKRLFREEVGLKGPRDGLKRRRPRAAKQAVETTPQPRLRATRRKADTAITVPAAPTPIPVQ